MTLCGPLIRQGSEVAGLTQNILCPLSLQTESAWRREGRPGWASLLPTLRVPTAAS